MTYRKITYGVKVIGLAGFNGSTNDDGTLFLSNDLNDDLIFTEDVEKYLEGIQDGLISEADPWTSRYKVGAGDFFLLNDDQDLISKAFSIDRTPAARISTDTSFTATDTQIDIDTQGAFSANDYIYLGNETMKVDSIANTGPSGDLLNVTRGIAGSPAEPHFSGQKIFTGLPYLAGRSVVLYVIDNSGIRAFDRGFIEDKRLRDQGSVLSFAVRPELNFLKNAEIADDNKPLSFRRGDIKAYKNSFEGRIPGYLNDNFTKAKRLLTDSNTNDTYLQIGEHVVEAEYDTSGLNTDIIIGDKILGSRTGPYEFEDNDTDEPFEYLDEDTDIYEIFVHSPESSILEKTFSSRNHVLDICLRLMLSTGKGHNDPDSVSSPYWDDLSTSFGLGIPHESMDTDKVLELISRYPEDQVDLLVLGWGGEPDNAWDLIRDLSRSLGYFWSRDSEGKWRPFKNRALSIRDEDELMNNKQSTWLFQKDSFDLDFRYRDTIKRLRATYDALPDEDPSNVTVSWGENRSELILRDSEASYDFSFLTDDLAELENRLSSILERRKNQAPVLKGTFTWEYDDLTNSSLLGRTPSVGDWVRIKAETSLPTSDGSQGSINNEDVAYTGRIIRQTRNTNSFTYDMDVLLYGWRYQAPTRVVAPAHEILSYGKVDPSDPDYANQTWIELIPNDLYEDAKDGFGFRKGDPLAFRDKQGVLASVHKGSFGLQVPVIDVTSEDFGSFSHPLGTPVSQEYIILTTSTIASRVDTGEYEIGDMVTLAMKQEYDELLSYPSRPAKLWWSDTDLQQREYVYFDVGDIYAL